MNTTVLLLLNLLLVINFCALTWSLIAMKKVGGRMLADLSVEVQRKELPFMAFIIGDDAMGCSATISSLTTVLTTAQCIAGKGKAMKAWAGTSRLRYRQDFDPPTQHRSIVKVALADEDLVEIHDVGVGFVESPWEINEFVQTIQIWIQTDLLPFDFYAFLLVAGWGFGNTTGLDRQLRETLMNIGSSILCPTTALQHLRQLMCSMDILHKTICKGDIGGPVLMDYPTVGRIQLGIIKSQQPLPNTETAQSEASSTPGSTEGPVTTTTPAPILDESCKVPALPNLFMFTGYYRRWLLQTIKDWPDLSVNWPTPNFSRPVPFPPIMRDNSVDEEEYYDDVEARILH